MYKKTYPKVVSVHNFSSRQGGISPSLYISPMLLTLFIVFAGRKHSMLLSSFNLSQQFYMLLLDAESKGFTTTTSRKSIDYSCAKVGKISQLYDNN